MIQGSGRNDFNKDAANVNDRGSAYINQFIQDQENLYSTDEFKNTFGAIPLQDDFRVHPLHKSLKDTITWLI
ncbi:MAG: hypothetical protein ACE5ER_04910 [Nitrospinaceae bacterium]